MKKNTIPKMIADIQSDEAENEAEKALLAGLLYGSTHIKDVELSVSDFRDSFHSDIYKSMLDIDADGGDIDVITVNVKLGGDENTFKKLLEISEMPDGLLNFKNYEKIIRDKEILRRKISTTQEYLNGKLTDEKLIEILLLSDDHNKIKFVTAADLAQIKIDITDTDIFGFKVQYPSIVALLGATSAGKSEYAFEIADLHSKIDSDHFSIICEYEANNQEIAIRLGKKGINGDRLIIEMSPSIKWIIKAVKQLKDKKILVIIDYLQEFAWDLSFQSRKNNDDADIIRNYINSIAVELNAVKNKFKNVCFVFISSLNNMSIRDNGRTAIENPMAILTGAKESGDIQFKMDYAYVLLFADENEKNENKWFLGRLKNDKIRKYIKLTVCKPKRILNPAENQIYVYDAELGRFCIIEPEIKQRNEKNKKTVDINEKYNNQRQRLFG